MTDDIALFDTNILVYAFDETAAGKHDKCKKIVMPIFKGEAKGIVSNQILAELFHVLTKKVRGLINAEKAAEIVFGFINSSNWIKVDYSSNTVGKAVARATMQKMHFWDALIAETML